eukprot:13358866-Alexandrium_andersonii.AAC.1
MAGAAGSCRPRGARWPGGSKDGPSRPSKPPPEGYGWGTEVGAWLLGSAGAAAWLTAAPGEAAEGLAAV